MIAATEAAGCPLAKEFSGKAKDWPMYKAHLLNNMRYQFNGCLDVKHMTGMPATEEEALL